VKFDFFSSAKNTFMNSSIRKKLILVNCFIILIVASSIGLTSYALYRETITNRLTMLNLRDIKQVATSIDYIQHEIEDLSSFIASDATVNRTISYTKEQLDNNPADQNYVEYMINNLLVAKNYVTFISVYADNGFSYYASSDKSSNIPEFDDIKSTKIYRYAYTMKGAPLWVYVPKENTDFIINNKGDKISMFRTLLKLNDYSTKAFMMISINTAVVNNLFENILSIKDSTIIFLDQYNNPFLNLTNIANDINVYDIKANLPDSFYNLNEGTEIYTYKGEKHLLTFTSLRCGWKIINVVPMRSFAINLSYVPVIVIVIFIFALVLGFYFTTYTASFLTKPIKDLVDSMDRVKKGNFKEKVKFKYNDEIGKLGKGYNEMISYINNLLNKVYALEIEERIAELKALQAQINPHFLYNTLDTIYWKAVGGDNKGVEDMIHALSKVFRLALNVGKEYFYIYQEKEFIGYYILLQEKRYKNKLNYSIYFTPDILSFKIPKLILQPFVENAIIHGTETNDKKTTINVSGRLLNGRIYFEIEDNGAGIPQDKLETLLNPDTEKLTPSKGGYGIKNVINRLSIYYNNDYSLKIDSELGKGTKVSISVPTSPQLDIERK